MTKYYRHASYSNFGFMQSVGNIFKKAPKASVVDSLNPTMLSGVAGMAQGNKIGGIGGALAGGLTGASYNPSTINPETGEEGRIGLLGRAGLVAGGAIGGNMLGRGLGRLAGGVVGVTDKSGKYLAKGKQMTEDLLTTNPEALSTLQDISGRTDELQATSAAVQKSRPQGRAGKRGRTTEYTRYPGSPVASFKHGVIRQPDFAPVVTTAGGATGAALGGTMGGILGSGLGSLGGAVAGATYNPDILDPETGERRKLGLLPRASLILGGMGLGQTAGAITGGAAGGVLGGTTGLLAGSRLPVQG